MSITTDRIERYLWNGDDLDDYEVRPGSGKSFVLATDALKANDCDEEKKLTHASVDYHEGAKENRCARCIRFNPQEDGNHGCQVVQKPIAEDGWCKLFEASKEAEDGFLDRIKNAYEFGQKLAGKDENPDIERLQNELSKAHGDTMIARGDLRLAVRLRDHRLITKRDQELTTAIQKEQAAKQRLKEALKRQGKDENPDIERRVNLPYGLIVYIENEEGSLRQGPWGEMIMKHPYGYLSATEGTDGDAVDCFLGKDYSTASTVYVVHQGAPDPEDKLMIGFNSAKEAADAYELNYHPEPPDYTMEKLQLRDLPAKLNKFRGKRIRGA